MNKLAIKTILERYFDGTSTIEEERQLKSYFTSGKVDPEFESFRSMFVFFVEERKETINEEFSISQKVKVIPIKKRSARWKLGIAAAILLLFASWFMMDKPKETPVITQQIDWSKYEPENNEQAVLLALAAMKRTSIAMKKGTQAAAQEILEVRHIVKSTLSNSQ